MPYRIVYSAPPAEYARHLRKSPLVLTVKGRPVAALVPIANADPETVSLNTHPRFIALIEHSRARLKKEGGISGQEMRRLGLKLRARRKPRRMP